MKKLLAVIIALTIVVIATPVFADAVVWLAQAECGVQLHWNRDPLFQLSFSDGDSNVSLSFEETKHHGTRFVPFPDGLGKKVEASVEAFHKGQWIGSDQGEFVNDCGIIAEEPPAPPTNGTPKPPKPPTNSGNENGGGDGPSTTACWFNVWQWPLVSDAGQTHQKDGGLEVNGISTSLSPDTVYHVWQDGLLFFTFRLRQDWYLLPAEQRCY